jgi:3-deoxy-7-phosphoheptulonate synthase
MLLPRHIEAVQRANLPVVWSCDPCHGNTIVTDNGYKTRPFCRIVSELMQTVDIHEQMNSYLGGVHLELTGENVTECLGGPEELNELDLPQKYTTTCDPRLNYAQSMEVAFLLANYLKHKTSHVRKRD